MKNALPVILAVLMALMLSISVVPAQEKVALREDFNNLDNWKPLTFPKIERHSEYVINLENDGNRILTTRSKASASGIVFKGSFNPFHYPILRWRWKVDNVYSKADPLTKQGDDYPLRVYVIFQYDPDKAGLAQRAMYGLAKRLYGEYPPLASINYVWASRDIAATFFDNPYTDRAKMIPLRSGTGQLGRWVEEEVNVLADYRRVFGKDPPDSASLAIMNDSDNTREAAISHMDFIEVGSSVQNTETSNPNP